ncbi:MAG: hypothetical protein U1D35_01785, partial [Paracoccaceae bacterium]|nr:hypothetical protein [Paracoccaceae bacterium]
QSRDAAITEDQARALQQIAWIAVQAQHLREAAIKAEAPAQPRPGDAEKDPVAGTATPAPNPVAPAAAAAGRADTSANAPAGFAPVTNPSLALGLSGVNDWAVQQPFLDVMKTARPWTGHLPGQWGGWDHARLAGAGYLDDDGWPRRMPAELTGLSTLILTELPADAGGVAGRYVLAYQGRGALRVEGRIARLEQAPGRIAFDFTPGPGGVLITITETDPADPIRAMTVLREDRQAAHAAGAIFNPDWLARIRGVRAVRFMDWMLTNNSELAQLRDRPKPGDYTWARIGVPIEVMVALANELKADSWFTLPHLAEDALVRTYAEVAYAGLAPGLRAHVEYSNEVWNWQFAQARWAEEQGRARWGQDQTWVQFYALRAMQVAGIWTQVYGKDAPARLVRVISTQTGWIGLEEAILEAPLVLAEGLPAPATAFDAYAVTGYFAALLGSDEKRDMVRGWLAESLAGAAAQADAQGLKGAARAAHIAAHRYDLATRHAAQELADGSVSGWADDTLAQLISTVLPHHAAVAQAHGLQLVMYEGGSHVVGYGAQTDDAELTAFFQHLNFTPEMGALYQQLLAGWAGLTDAPFNAFVDVYAPTKWGSWGALRHLGDDNPRWQALAKGCPSC